jgi:hypothetical protein
MTPPFRPERPVLRDYEAWKQEWAKPGFTVADYLANRSTVDLAAAHVGLFWPELVEVEGHVLLARNYDPETFRRWRRETRGDRVRTESVVNHLHLYDAFPRSNEGNTDPSAFAYLIGALTALWARALRERFPDRRFVFEHGSEPEEYGPTITFFQEEADPPAAHGR